MAERYIKESDVQSVIDNVLKELQFEIDNSNPSVQVPIVDVFKRSQQTVNELVRNMDMKCDHKYNDELN